MRKARSATGIASDLRLLHVVTEGNIKKRCAASQLAVSRANRVSWLNEPYSLGSSWSGLVSSLYRQRTVRLAGGRRFGSR
jgi:hypothetical protein